MVNLASKLRLNKNDYHLIRNVTIPTEDGSTRIDHIIVSRFGIFVVETKNMKGWIYGGKHQETWRQEIRKSKHQFQNPLYQNFKHCKTLVTLLGIEPDKLFSVIVFVGDSIFVTPMPDNVTHGGGYIRYIKSRTQLLLTETEVQQIIQQITDGRLKPSIKTHLEHAKHMRDIVASTKSCPRCGSSMVLRTAKKGLEAGNQFWGCSTFPKCRMVSDLE